MAERIRLLVDTTEVLRRAVNIHAAREGVSPSDVMNDLIRTHLPEAVAEAERAVARQQEQGGDSSPKPKRGRKPKSPPGEEG